MAQYYQIVGQGTSLTIEDLQRYCPNICLDRIIVNQEDQQYGQQQVVVQQTEQPNDVRGNDGGQSQLVVREDLQYQQQQYIIRHEATQQPPPPEFRQQQQRQIHQHQVYYASDLPMDTQVVLQQAQQIIDASLMQQTPTSRQQHLASPAHVVPQPSVIHPAQQPPPQPPPPSPLPPPASLPPQSAPPTPPTAPQQQQQLGRATISPAMLQQMQQQQQLHQHQQLQQMHQQHAQHPPQHQQVVMHAAYTNQAGTPTRAPAARLMGQTTPPGVTLVRTPVRTVRPRSRTVRPNMQSPARALSQHLQANPGGIPRAPPRAPSPRVVKPQSQQVQHRVPRPRTPLQQQLVQQQQQQSPQPHQQQQLVQHALQQQLHQQQLTQQQQLAQQQQLTQQQQLNHHKLTPHQQQILINQQQQQQQNLTHSRVVASPHAGPVTQATRMITQQGTIVQHNHIPQSNNVQLPQSQLSLLTQRASPAQQQIKKVVVPSNHTSNDMDDLEESITAAVLPKPINEPQFHTASCHRQNVAQFNFNPPYQTQQVFDPQQQHFNQMIVDDNHEDKGQMVTLSNGQCIPLSEYKRLQHMPQMQQHLPREAVRQTLVTRKEPQRPVQRVQPMQSMQPQPQQPHVSEPPEGAVGISEQNADSAKMLIFLQNGEQRLITFTLPKESCTLQEVLEQVNVPFSEDTNIQCVQNISSEIDYIVSIGSSTRIDEMLENHPILLGDLSSRSSPVVVSQPQTSEHSTPEKEPAAPSSPEPPRSPPPRLVDGMLALCKPCGYTGFDFNRCQRCRRVFTEEPKSVPIASKKVADHKKEPEKLNSMLEKPNSSGETIRLNLLKPVLKTVKNNATYSQEKKPRLRKPRGKQPEPEPVILTLSSDEEDSNSSNSNNQYENAVSSKEPSVSDIERADLEYNDGLKGN